jgi:pyrroloquinoline quinone biosynthesis protein D
MAMDTQLSDNARPRLARGVRLQIDCTTGKGVLLYPEGVIELNETAQEILTRCDGRSVSEIATLLAADYDVNRQTIAADVHETMTDLHRRNLIELE